MRFLLSTTTIQHAFVICPCDDVPAAVIAGAVSALCFYVLRQYATPLPPGAFVPPIRTRGVAGLVKQHLADLMDAETCSDALEFVHRTQRMEDAACFRPIGMRLFFMQRVWVSHPADVAAVLAAPSNSFAKGAAYTALSRFLGDGLLTLVDDTEHAFHRRILNPAFAPFAVRAAADGIVRDNVAQLLAQVRLFADSGSPVCVQRVTQRVALSSVVGVAFRCREETSSFLLGELFATMNVGASAWAVMLPWSRYLPLGPEARTARRRIDAWTDALTKRVRAAQADQERPTVAPMVAEASSSAAAPLSAAPHQHATTVIDCMLQSGALTDRQVADHAVTFVFAGFDTVHICLCWTIALLATTPRVQQRLYEELSEVFALGTTGDSSEIARCTFLGYIVKESLRLCPPVPSVTRIAATDQVLPGTGTFIPAGTPVMCNFHGVHHAAELWGSDVDEFRPERWGEVATLEVLRRNPGAFLPFGTGRRNCIGKDLALCEVSMVLAAIFRSFEVVWPSQQKFPARHLQTTMRPKELFKVTFRRRRE